MAATPTQAPEFKVGDKVAFVFGGRRVRGRIVEDRGALGLEGRRLYRVRLDMDPYDPMFFVLPEDDIEITHESDAPLSKDEIREYLVNGGLILILGSNADGHGPRVWLRRDNLGNVTHTFNKDAGLVGGDIPPVFAVQFGRIFRAMREQVEHFIMSFGLNAAVARAIVGAVGCHP